MLKVKHHGSDSVVFSVFVFDLTDILKKFVIFGKTLVNRRFF